MVTSGAAVVTLCGAAGHCEPQVPQEDGCPGGGHRGQRDPWGLRKGEVIMLMATNALGVWTVTRRSTLLRLWDAVTGAMKASCNVR